MNRMVKTDALSDTMWMLMARYKGRPMIPASEVCDDFFQPLTYPKFLDKVNHGVISLPLVRMEESQKTPRYVSLQDLSFFLDARRELALEEQL
jgi:hypothetical protein